MTVARRFRPSLGASMLVLLLCTLMITACRWQLQRGREKEQLLAAAALAMQAAPVTLPRGELAPPPGQLRHVQATGTYLPDQQVLLDNQSHQQKPGYHIWTALQMADGRRLIVDRGWISLSSGQSGILPPPDGVQTIHGYWRSLPRAGMRLKGAAVGCETPRPWIVNYPDAGQCRCLFGDNLQDGLLELASDVPDGAVRDWSTSGPDAIPPSRHYAYALQWALFAVTLLALFFRLSLKPVEPLPRKSPHD